MISGKFDATNEVSCPNTGGRQTYYNSVTEMFLYYLAPNSEWYIGTVCGQASGVVAYGVAGLHPFEDTAATWQCNGNFGFVTKPVSIECSFYIGQHLPCISGTYEPSGEAPNGECR
jgi:hypothetical protein